MRRKHIIPVLMLLCGISVLVGFSSGTHNLTEGSPLYINDMFMTDGNILTAEKGTSSISLYSADGKSRLKSWATKEIPTGVTTDGKLIYATTSDKVGGVEIINTESEEQATFIPTGRGACSPVLNKDCSKLYICNQFATTVSEIDLATNSVSREVRVVREPRKCLMSPDERYLFVSNFLPSGRADRDTMSACVSVIDMTSFQTVKNITLANGSNALRGSALTCDGKYLLLTHNLGRFQVPTSQLQQGWMNTSGMSVIKLEDLSYGGTILLDEPDRGAAGIWEVRCTPEHIITTHSGTHEISLIDYQEFIGRYESYPDKQSLSYDLRFLEGIRKRIPVRGNGPRCMLVNDGQALVYTYFSDTLNFIPLAAPETMSLAALVTGRQESKAQKGEKYFNDASYCFQNWQSCNGCHPGEGRTDGLNWDNLNDGIGNPKNCKSMIYAMQTPPSMISGIRKEAKMAVRAGFKYIQFNEVSEDIAECVDEYIRQLEPVASPYLVNGELSEKALRGKKVYEKYKCDQCHNGQYYTDLQMYRIGEDIEFEAGWDTPTLCEVWRTAPYLFDGRAGTMEEVFSVHKHGLDKARISDKEIEELVEYVNSL